MCCHQCGPIRIGEEDQKFLWILMYQSEGEKPGAEAEEQCARQFGREWRKGYGQDSSRERIRDGSWRSAGVTGFHRLAALVRPDVPKLKSASA